eukprot:12884856-Prorocentrum_lima.AAC.1
MQEVAAEGCLLHRAGVPDDLVHLLRQWNEKVYFQFGSSADWILAEEGLKQGCPSASPCYTILNAFQI